MKKQLSLLVTFFYYAACFSQAQEKYSCWPDFRSPLDTAIVLAGNFGEIRTNHFHSGLDIRTNSREGLNIYAVADGYVSRIKISATGYGKALYITHPNGYVSVYAHLSAFNDSVARYVKKMHYQKETYEIDVSPAKNEVPVKRGEIVAFSGNTGSSSGPHLHFEIRDEKTEIAINPMFFGFEVPDHQKPRITELAIYPIDVNSYVDGVNKKKEMPVYCNSGVCAAKETTITVSGNIGFGIEGYDTEDNAPGKNGIYSIELLLNDKRIYYHAMESFALTDTRYINSHVDYEEVRTTGHDIQKSFLQKDNKLTIYKDIVDRGIVSFINDSIYHLKYIAKDFYGNTSVLLFAVKSQKIKPMPILEPLSKYAAIFHCTDSNCYNTNDVRVNLPANILYEDMRFKYAVYKDSSMKYLSPVYQINTDDVPVHTYYSLSIKPIKKLSDALMKKAFIALFDTRNGRKYMGGEWKDGWVTAQTRSFGKFAVMIDTIAPYVSPYNIRANKNVSKQQSIAFKIGDNLSEIKDYRGTIDGKWVLFEYEPKKSLIFYTIDKSLTPGKHQLVMTVKDGRDNERKVTMTFFN